MKITRTNVAIALCLLYASGAAVACSNKGGASAAPSASGSASGKGKSRGMQFAVEVQKVEIKPVEYVVTAPGSIEAFEQVQVTARVAGAIDRVSFAEGATVKKGQVLVSIESERYQLAVNVAKATLAKTQAAQAGAEADLARREGAAKTNPGLIPGEEIASYRTKLDLAKADASSAQEALKQAELNLRDSYARAPIAGVIQTRSVQTGQYVAVGTVMATLLQRDPLLLRFQVGAEDAPRLKPGMSVAFRLRESQRTYPAKVTLVAGTADVKSRLVPVTAEIDDTEHRYWLRPGAFCEVSATIGDARQAPVIPQLAIRPSERGFLAYVVENGVAKERILKLGMHTLEGTVEVIDGLKGGEMLVVRGAEPLIDGSPVRITDPDGGAPMHGGHGDGGAFASAGGEGGSPAHSGAHAAGSASAPR
jgi:RND family efflux transporter MFP subunit